MSSGVIGGLIAAALVSLVTWLATRRRPGAGPVSAAFYGLAARVLWTFCGIAGLGFIVLAIYSALIGNPTATWWVVSGLCVMGLAGCAGAYDSYTRSVDWTGERVVFRKWDGARSASWDDIVSVEIKPLLRFARIKFSDGRGFAITEFFTGGRDLLAEMKSRGKLFMMWGKPLRN